jgi:uncharacterized protein with von Willebrand factor type A (vWA) domain
MSERPTPGWPLPVDARPGDEVSIRLITLTRLLRDRGFGLGSDAVLRAHRALDVVDVTDRHQCRAALRGVLCSRREHLPLFDAAFAECFGDNPSGPPASTTRPGVAADQVADGATTADAQSERTGSDAQDTDGEPTPAAVWSPAEVLRHKDFADYTAADEQAALAEIRRLASVVPHRRSRRMLRCERAGERVHLRATIRAATRTGGEVVEMSMRRRSTAPRPLVLVCDVSASMAPYARMFMHYLHAAVQQGHQVEAFVFGTRLTRVTAHLGSPQHTAALARIAQDATDWGAGTRIGESIAQLNRHWGNRVGRGSVVIVLSDGWDCGDPDLLAAELGRLRRCSHSLIWLNPLRARPGYEPLTRGMRAALPQTDVFESGNSLAALQLLGSIPDGGPRRDKRRATTRSEVPRA